MKRHIGLVNLALHLGPIRTGGVRAHADVSVPVLATVMRDMYKWCIGGFSNGLRPYHPEHARSRPISEAKQGRAWLVLGWETAWEYQVL